MALVIPCMISEGIYSGFIGTIRNATINICRIFTSIYYIDNLQVNLILHELDIEYKLSLFNILFQHINQLIKNNPKINSSNDPIIFCFKSLIKTIDNIELVLLKISEKIKRHNIKWFNKWRYLDTSLLIEELRNYNNQLINRFNDLIRITEFIKNMK